MESPSSLLKMAPYASLLFMTLISSCCILLSKVILVQGTSPTVFLAYQFFVSTLSLALLAFIFERKRIPPLTTKILLEIFFLALVGQTFAQIMWITALYYISSTIESASVNLCPAVTYIICVIIRQEKLQLQTVWGSGKALGTLISVSGAFCLFFWHESSKHLTDTDSTNWAIGLLLLAGAVLANSTWIIMVGGMARRYPAEMSLTAIMMFFATIQIVVVAAVMNHEASQWQLNWSLELLNIVVSGTLTTGLFAFLTAWCARIKGPVFVTSFTPLGVPFNAILDFLFYGQGMVAGSVVGSILIVLGLYLYLWSKSNEDDEEDIMKANNETTTSLL